ncbi:hypothetical protein EV586_101877 [Tumebacillus sp. BK434]|uniref:hypothetical protein n=1 Tax=Tumebacillus sp. BK434 TaxID=2512169 RepID=UPI001052DB21|nr:hypothetical protein [Tumebacillus sp. BK434]TCP59645.1 hypothetical protein EV586_101877 [Tumebacillus sp. BK434]
MRLLLPVSLLLLTLLLLGTQLALTTQDLHITAELTRSDQAYYLAEAALHLARSRLQQNPAWRGQQESVPLGEGSYSYRVYEQGTTVHIEATGQIGKIKTLLKKTF